MKRKIRDGSDYLKVLQLIAQQEFGFEAPELQPKLANNHATIKHPASCEDLVSTLCDLRGFRSLVATLVAARSCDHELLQTAQVQNYLKQEALKMVRNDWPQEFSSLEVKDFICRQAEIGEMASLWPGQTKILNSLMAIIKNILTSSPMLDELFSTATWQKLLRTGDGRKELRRWLVSNDRFRQLLMSNTVLREDIAKLLETADSRQPTKNNLYPFRSYMIAASRSSKEE